MNSIKVSLDSTQYSSKPKDGEIGKISNRIARYKTTVNPDNMESFVKAVGEHGQTFCQATFANGTRKKDSFEQMQLFVLDFDGGISKDDVFKRAEKYDLPILFAYDTFSSVDHDRFRIVFHNDIPRRDRRVAEIQQNALVTIFPEADKSSKEITRMYFGGKKLLHYDRKKPKITIESTIRNMSYYLKDRYGNTHYKRKIREFSEQNNLKLNRNNLIDVSIETYQNTNSV